ncbi:MAG: transcriptional regulator [Rubrobacteridae bacterium]|nr:transcriptional regulator [Rubrobacteridae bacterium]
MKKSLKMRLHRIGDKVVDSDKISNLITEILQRRAIGATQQEVAVAMGLERSFVSHLEGLGEVRRGNRIAIIGFPVSNREELFDIAQSFGIDFVYLLSESERKDYVGRRNGSQLFNELFDLLASLRDYDIVIFLGSDKRISDLSKILNREIIGIEIGNSPIKRDRKVEPDVLADILSKITEGKELDNEAYSKRKFRIFKKKSSSKSKSTR